MSISKIFAVIAVLSISGCAYLGTGEQEDDLSLRNSSDDKMILIDSFLHKGSTPYKFGKASFAAEWMSCTNSKSKKSVLVMHQETIGFDSQNFCTSWVGQSFLSAGYNVVTVNRPGFGASTGKQDFSGLQSMKAIKATLIDAASKSKISSITGIWGYSSGAVAAARYAKEISPRGLKFLILGSGVYDLEETAETTKDGNLKDRLAQIKTQFGDDAFDSRSIAYDVEGLPKKIFLYHGKKDKAVLPSQSRDFYDSLISSEYRVSLEMIKGIGHKIPEKTHRKILQVLAHSAK